jgi:hypothetical protein
MRLMLTEAFHSRNASRRVLSSLSHNKLDTRRIREFAGCIPAVPARRFAGAKKNSALNRKLDNKFRDLDVLTRTILDMEKKKFYFWTTGIFGRTHSNSRSGR